MEVEANSVDGEANQAKSKRKAARVSNVKAPEATGVLWVAPLAKMYQDSNIPHCVTKNTPCRKI